MCIDVAMSSIPSNYCIPWSEYQIICQKDVSTLLRDLSCSSSKKTGISCKTSTLPPIGQRRKVTEKPSAVKEHCKSLPVLQSNQLGTWSELGGSIDLLSSHSTVTRLQKWESTVFVVMEKVEVQYRDRPNINPTIYLKDHILYINGDFCKRFCTCIRIIEMMFSRGRQYGGAI